MLGKIHEFLVQIRHRINTFPIQFSYALLHLNLLSKKSKTIIYLIAFLQRNHIFFVL